MSESPDDLAFLTQCEWLPARCDPARAMNLITTGASHAVWNLAKHAPVPGLPVTEQLAIAYAVLHGHGNPSSAAMMSFALEHLGLTVSPEFAEQGVCAWALLETIEALERDTPDISLALERSLHNLGVLWATAFEAPMGYGHYITRSLLGLVPSGLGFLPDDDTPSAADSAAVSLGEQLRHGVDLLHAALTLYQRPGFRWPEEQQVQYDWRNPVIEIPSGWGHVRPGTLQVHARLEKGAAGGSGRVWIWLESSAGVRVAWAEATLLIGQTGVVDEFVEMTSGRTEVGRQIRSVFGGDEAGVLTPRVRRLLDRAENNVRRVLVLENLGVLSEWRGRRLGGRMLQQLLIESGDVDVVLGRPRLELPPHALGASRMGEHAAEAMACLRQARAWAGFGADYLQYGVMGLAAPQIRVATNNAQWDRYPKL